MGGLGGGFAGNALLSGKLPDITPGTQYGFDTGPSVNGSGLPDTGTSGKPDTSGLETRDEGGWTFVKVFDKDLLGRPTGSFHWQALGKSSTGSGGGAGRNDALTAAVDALNGYLSASNSAETRRMDAFNQFKALSGLALPKGAKTAPGYEAGGPAQAFAASIGIPTYTPPPIQTAEVNPQMLAQEPALSPAVQAMLGAITGAGGNAAAQNAAQG